MVTVFTRGYRRHVRKLGTTGSISCGNIYFILNISIFDRSLQLYGTYANEIKYVDHLTVAIVVLVPTLKFNSISAGPWRFHLLSYSVRKGLLLWLMFIVRTRRLSSNLQKHGYLIIGRLKPSLMKFYGRYKNLRECTLMMSPSHDCSWTFNGILTLDKLPCLSNWSDFSLIYWTWYRAWLHTSTGFHGAFAKTKSGTVCQKGTLTYTHPDTWFHPFLWLAYICPCYSEQLFRICLVFVFSFLPYVSLNSV